MVSKNILLAELPPYRGLEKLIVREQSLTDIIKLTKKGHTEYAPHYERIAHHFGNSGGTEKELFDFVTKNVRYRLQDEKFQSIESPAAILAMGQGDCKHMASFIGGILDAKNRLGHGWYDWHYRFAGYNNKKIGHVYVVVDNGGKEIWIDPAPVLNEDGTQEERYFNDRKIYPTKIRNIKPKTMALYQVSGIAGSTKGGIVSTTTVSRKEVNKFTKPGTCSCAGIGLVQPPYSADPYFMTIEQDSGGGYVYEPDIKYPSVPPVETVKDQVIQPTAEPPMQVAPQIQYDEVTHTVVDVVPTEVTTTVTPDKPAEKPGMLKQLWELAKANPVPAVAIGVGTILLIGAMTSKKKKKRA